MCIKNHKLIQDALKRVKVYSVNVTTFRLCHIVLSMKEHLYDSTQWTSG